MVTWRWLLTAVLGAGLAAPVAGPVAHAAPDISAPNPPFISFNGLPPEINSGRIFAGPGVASPIAAAEAWAGLADELNKSSQSFDAIVNQVGKPAGSGKAAANAGVYDPVPEPKPRPADNSDELNR